jgi:hypothetical protein
VQREKTAERKKEREAWCEERRASASPLFLRAPFFALRPNKLNAWERLIYQAIIVYIYFYIFSESPN